MKNGWNGTVVLAVIWLAVSALVATLILYLVLVALGILP